MSVSLLMNGPERNLAVFALLLVLALLVYALRDRLAAYARRRRRAQTARIQVEDALKHLSKLEIDGMACGLESLGGALELNAAHVVALVERLQEMRLVRLGAGAIALTEEGRRYALQVVRAHRLWERYLADETGVSPMEWHKRAERREHSLTPADADALAARLGDPRFDPHGDPIPTAEGELPGIDVTPLSELSAGESARVVHVEDEPDVVYAQLVALGVYPGQELRVVARTEKRVLFESDGRQYVLAPIVAVNVSVTRIAVAAVAEGDAAVSVLSELAPGESAKVLRISPACRGIVRRRLMDLGIVPGTDVVFERCGLTGGLNAYRVRGTVIALREEQTEMIAIRKEAVS